MRETASGLLLLASKRERSFPMNIARQYAERAILLQNLLQRITPLRGKDKSFSLKGVITLEERNAIVVGLYEMKDQIARLKLQ